jgi:chromosome segregation ATPase
MADTEVRYIFPEMARVAVHLDGAVRREFEVLIREKGWTAEEGIKILLGYAAAVARQARLSEEEARNELGAARGELAVLRHRAYMADDGIRTLKMNVTGFEKSLEQFEKSLPRMEREHQELEAQLDGLLAEAARRGIVIEPEEPEPVTAQRSLIEFYRRNGRG